MPMSAALCMCIWLSMVSMWRDCAKTLLMVRLEVCGDLSKHDKLSGLDTAT